MKTFTERFVKVYQDSQKSQQGFADSINVSEKTFRNYRDGFTQPNADVLAEIAKAYNVNCEWLILGEGPIYKDQTLTQRELPALNHPAIKQNDNKQEYADLRAQMTEMQKTISTLIQTNQQLVDKILSL